MPPAAPPQPAEPPTISPSEPLAPADAEIEAALRQAITRILPASLSSDHLFQQMTIRRNDAYWKGMQYVAPEFSSGIVDYFPIASSGLGLQSSVDAESAYDYVVNVYKGDTRKLVAVLSQRPPNIQAQPISPENPEHVASARKAQRIAQALHTVVDWERVNERIAFSFATKGTTFLYTPYVVNREQWGSSQVPTYSQRDHQIDEGSFSCPECGEQGPGNPAACPTCGASGLSSTPPLALAIMAHTGYQDIDNGGPMVYVLSAADITTPFYSRDLSEAPWLRWDEEKDLGSILTAYPQLRQRGLSIAGGGSAPFLSGRSTRLQLTSLTGSSGTYSADRVPLTRLWIRPSQYEYINLSVPDDPIRDHIRGKYPSGLKLTMIGDIFCKIQHESIDEVWAAESPDVSDYIWTPPYMDDMIQGNDIINDAHNINVESLEKSVPMHLINPKIIDPSVLRNKGRIVGEYIPVKQGFGGALREAMADFQAAKVDPGILNYSSNLLSQFRSITGILPPIFGGDEGRQTAREAELKRNQALMAISVPWHAQRRLFRRGYRNLTVQVAKYSDGSLYLPTGVGAGNVELSLGDLGIVMNGGWRYSVEDSVPMSPGQIRDSLIEMVSQNQPEVLDRLGYFHPENLSTIEEVFGFPGWVIPGAKERERVHALISQLLQAAPTQDPASGQPAPSVQPDPFLIDPSLGIEVVRSWLLSDEGEEMEQTNPDGWYNVLLLGKHWQMMMQPPPGPPPSGGADQGQPPLEGEGPQGPPPQGAPMPPQIGVASGGPPGNAPQGLMPQQETG